MLAGLRRDDGSSLVLTIGYAALALVLVLLVTAATSLYLERKRLLALADSVALVGAESFSLTEVIRDGDGLHPALTDAGVATASARFLGTYSGDSLVSVRLERANSVDGRSARVTLSSEWSPPVLTLFVPALLRIEATSTARSVFW